MLQMAPQWMLRREEEGRGMDDDSRTVEGMQRNVRSPVLPTVNHEGESMTQLSRTKDKALTPEYGGTSWLT